MMHRFQYSPHLQRELKVREISAVQRLVNVSLGVGTAAVFMILGALAFATIPH